jgi:hypothetical protein
MFIVNLTGGGRRIRFHMPLKDSAENSGRDQRAVAISWCAMSVDVAMNQLPDTNIVAPADRWQS